MRTKETAAITIRTTITQTIRIEKSSETEKSTVTPLIVIVLGRKG